MRPCLLRANLLLLGWLLLFLTLHTNCVCLCDDVSTFVRSKSGNMDVSGNSETIFEFPTHERRGPGKESGKSGKGCEECLIGEIFWVLLQLVMCQDIARVQR